MNTPFDTALEKLAYMADLRVLRKDDAFEVCTKQEAELKRKP